MESIAEIPKLKGEGQHYSENHQPLLLYISYFKKKIHNIIEINFVNY
jgi:hypothetical protein